MLFAIEHGIQRRAPDSTPTPAEHVLLAVLALLREVGNGEFAQFFVNSSRQFAPTIVASLRRIDCPDVAALAEQALAALGADPVTPDSVLAAIRHEDAARDAVLESLDQQFYRIGSIIPNLFRFVETNAADFALEKVFVAPPEKSRGATNAGRIELALEFDKHTDFSPSFLRELAIKLAAPTPIPATEADIEGAVTLYLFSRAIDAGDLPARETLAPRAFNLKTAVGTPLFEPVP